MISARTQITVDAPPEEVFAFVDEPENRVKVVPSLLELSDISRTENGRSRARYRYLLAGVELSGTLRETRRQAPDRLVQSLSGAMDGTLDYSFEPADGGTLVTHAAEYDLPRTVVESVVESIAQTYAEQELEATLANLKAHLEA